MISDELSGLILDYLGVRPNSRVIENSHEQEMCFKGASHRRNIRYSTNVEECLSEQADLVIFYLRQRHDNSLNAKMRAVVICKKISWFHYMILFIKHKPKEIVRIIPDTEYGIYMNSLRFKSNFFKTYKELDCGRVKKVLVALRVAVTPAKYYPVMVFIL